MQIMVAFALQRRLQGTNVTVSSVEPGYVSAHTHTLIEITRPSVVNFGLILLYRSRQISSAILRIRLFTTT